MANMCSTTEYSLRICYVPVETAGDIMVKENR